ncbi:MAG: flagellar P-ring protein FlgI [Thermotogota bacterium]|nr:flagellar P-ring protein FlgI [Thermotogota bacterium]MDK2864541.1 flagellar P-ring protein FlgI [Thermotogota bacterium]
MSIKRRLKILALLALVFSICTAFGARLKDIAVFRGARDNQLFGVGIVVGLAGTGDSGSAPSTLVANMLKNFGINLTVSDLKSKNTALVMVVADIPAFYKEGMRLDVVVSALGDAKTLEGGVLLQTPLYGADGNVYAVAQGNVSLGGADVKSSINLQSRFKTVGYIPGGAIVEREIPSSLVENDSVTIHLNQPDITTAARAAQAINLKFDREIARAVDPATIRVKIPEVFENDLITFLSIVESVELAPDAVAKVVINERTGTVIFGGNVELNDFTLSYGSFNISVTAGMIEDKNATIENLIAALKALGATPQDIIAIIETLAEGGILHAQVVTM